MTDDNDIYLALYGKTEAERNAAALRLLAEDDHSGSAVTIAVLIGVVICMAALVALIVFWA